MILDKKVIIFLAIADSGSFSQASRKLSLSQSVISFHLDSLEKEIGFELFRRMGRKIELSEKGAELYERLKKIDLDARVVEDMISDFSTTVTKKIYLAGESLTCAFTLPWALAAFREKNQDVHFSYRYLDQETIQKDLLDKKIDMAFVGHPIRHKKLEHNECIQDEIVLVSAPGKLPAEIPAVQLTDLPLIWIKGDRGLELLIKKMLKEVGISQNKLNIFMEVEDLAILKNLVRSGVVSAFLPKLTVYDEARFGLVTTTSIKNLNIQRTTYHVYLKQDSPREVFSRFLNFIDQDDWKEKFLPGKNV